MRALHVQLRLETLARELTGCLRMEWMMRLCCRLCKKPKRLTRDWQPQKPSAVGPQICEEVTPRAVKRFTFKQYCCGYTETQNLWYLSPVAILFVAANFSVLDQQCGQLSDMRFAWRLCSRQGRLKICLLFSFSHKSSGIH